MSENQRANLWAWVPPIVWMLVIFAASSMPGSSIPPNQLAVVGHVAEYSILALLLYRAMRRWTDPTVAILAAVLGSSAYGLTDEIHQVFVSGRSPDGWDWVTDTGAAIAAMALVVLVRALLRRRPRLVQ